MTARAMDYFSFLSPLNPAIFFPRLRSDLLSRSYYTPAVLFLFIYFPPNYDGCPLSVYLITLDDDAFRFFSWPSIWSLQARWCFLAQLDW